MPCLSILFKVNKYGALTNQLTNKLDYYLHGEMSFLTS